MSKTTNEEARPESVSANATTNGKKKRLYLPFKVGDTVWFVRHVYAKDNTREEFIPTPGRIVEIQAKVYFDTDEKPSAYYTVEYDGEKFGTVETTRKRWGELFDTKEELLTKAFGVECGYPGESDGEGSYIEYEEYQTPLYRIVSSHRSFPHIGRAIVHKLEVYITEEGEDRCYYLNDGNAIQLGKSCFESVEELLKAITSNGPEQFEISKEFEVTLIDGTKEKLEGGN